MPVTVTVPVAVTAGRGGSVGGGRRVASVGGPPPASAVPPASGPSVELTAERIVRAAMEIADHEGLAALSMRSVAARLGVAAMSPYRYVPSKDDLVLLMADAAFGEESYPAEPPGEWRARLELGAHTLWRIYPCHPWPAQVGALTRPLMLPALLDHAEWALAALDGRGLDAATMLDLHVLLYSYVQGIAVHLEREAQAEAPPVSPRTSGWSTRARR